jgi:hypothetical protein
MCLGEMVTGVRCEGARGGEGGGHSLEEVDYRSCRDEWLLGGTVSDEDAKG